MGTAAAGGAGAAGAGAAPAAANGAAPAGAADNLAFLQNYAADPDAAGAKGPEDAKKPEDKQDDKGKKPDLGPAKPPEVAVKNIRDKTEQGVGFLKRLGTPGSILFPLAALLIFWILMMRVGGKTRWEWLWDTLTGNAAVQTTASKAAEPPKGGINQEPDPAIKAAFSQRDVPVTELQASTIVPRTFDYTPSSSIAVTGAPG